MVTTSLSPSWVAHADIANPTWLTAQSAGGTGFDSGRAITVTGAGRAVVVGTFWDVADFPRTPTQSITLTSQAFGSAAFVAGLDAQDEYFAWALRIAGTSFQLLPTAVTSMGKSTPSTSDDTILITGYFNGTAYFPTGPTDDDSIALTAVSNGDAFIASVVPDGSSFAWARKISPSTGDVTEARPRAIAVDAAGRATIFGEYSTGHTLNFPTAGAPIGLPGRGTNTLFAARFNAGTGYFDWAQRNLGTPTVSVTGGSQAGLGTSAPSDDRLLVSGMVNPGTTYFPTGRPAPDDSIALTAAGADTFVAALNADDSYFAWVRGFSGPSGGVLVGRADGGLVLAGGYTGTAYFPRGPGDDSLALASTGLTDIYVAEMNADDSYFHSAVSAGGSGNDQVRAVTETSDGLALVAGSFTQSASFPSPAGPISIANTGGSGSFLAQVGRGGIDFDWAVFATGTTGSDSAIAYGVAADRDNRALITGQIAGTVVLPGARGALSLTSRGSNDVLVASAGTIPAPAPTPPDPTPATAPMEVAASAGDATASVSWTAPASVGSFPVTNYQVTSTPGGRVCLTSALSCEVTGLTNGAAYTFTVKALTGAGWSPASEPSNAVTPVATPRPTITITGSREGKRIAVTGSTTGMGMGGLVTPWASRGARSAAPGKSVEVSIDGGFTWSRIASSRATWSIYFTTGDGIHSNTVVFASR